ncbi:MAG: DUF1579 family protein [Candidatus Dormibacteria bacterium]
MSDFIRGSLPKMLAGEMAKLHNDLDGSLHLADLDIPEMRKLHFLLGDWECETLVYPPGADPAPGRIYGTVKPVLRGAWLEWNFTQEPNTVVEKHQTGRYTFGWNPAVGKFTAIYYDDRGNCLVEETSGADYEDGVLRFAGTTILTEEGEVFFTDAISSKFDGHFRNEVHMTINGERRLHGVIEAKRK